MFNIQNFNLNKIEFMIINAKPQGLLNDKIVLTKYKYIFDYQKPQTNYTFRP